MRKKRDHILQKLAKPKRKREADLFFSRRRISPKRVTGKEARRPIEDVWIDQSGRLRGAVKGMACRENNRESSLEKEGDAKESSKRQSLGMGVPGEGRSRESGNRDLGG